MEGRIRLKNLLDEAEGALIARGLRAPDARQLLAPAREIVEQNAFWQFQSDGLAMFIAQDTLLHYRLPLEFEERVAISGRHYLKPLIPLLSGDGLFFIIALSQDEIRLLQATRYRVGDVILRNVPTSIQEALRFDDPETHLQWHTSTAEPQSVTMRAAVFHGHGTGEGEDQKGRILRYLQQVDAGLHELIGDRRAPVVLTGVEYVQSIYRQTNSLPGLLEGGVSGNPKMLSRQELHARAWAVAGPHLQKERGEAMERYRNLAGARPELTVELLQDVVLAAFDGRVDTLFVPLRVQHWGTFSAEQRVVRLQHEEPHEAEELLDLAAILALLAGGNVYAVEPGDAPSGTEVAAILRF